MFREEPGEGRTMRLLPSILLMVVVGCSPAPSPSATALSTAKPTATPGYSYPDLPGEIEVTIAEADCEQLDGIVALMDRDSVDPVVRHDAMDAISHRSRELGC
jgi:hypothetical protein